MAITFDCGNGVVSGQGSTPVTSDSASGQAVLNVSSTTGFDIGEVVEIGYGTARQETGRISAISANSSITLESNLTFSHTAAQGDTIQKQLRHWGLPFIRYGTATGVYSMESEVPDRSAWGPIFTGWQTTYNGSAVAWNKIGHSITLKNLYPATTYYIQACAYTPHGEICVSSETTFTTAADTAYTDPGASNVKSGTTYLFNSILQTGTLALLVIGLMIGMPLSRFCRSIGGG